MSSTECGHVIHFCLQGRCLPLQCTPGKELVNSSCSTPLKLIRGLGYSINMWFYVNRSRLETSNDAGSNDLVEDIHSNFLNQVMQILHRSIDVYDLTIGAVVVDSPQDRSTHTLNTISSSGNQSHPDRRRLESLSALWVHGYLGANDTIPRDEFEAGVLDDLVNNNISMKCLDYAFTFSVQISVRDFDMVNLCLQSNVECIVKRKLKEQPVDSISNLFEETSSFLTLGKVLNCQTVSFNTDFYKVTKTFITSAMIEISLQLGQTELRFTRVNELNEISIDENDILKVCKDFLNYKLESLDEEMRREFYSKYFRAEADDITEVQYYTTLVCVGVSMLCLLLAIITYFRFNVLRTVAGMNNIFLCGSLLLAQASLLTSVHVSGPQTLCTVLGFATHFLWLWMFTWSFICCWRVFKVFTTNTRQEKTARSQRASFVRTVLVSVLPPAGIICTVVTVSLATSDGDRTGYGRKSCYLDSGLLIGLSTALPLALVTVSNIAFFSLAVMKINNVKKLQSSDFQKKEDRKNLSIYVKLSTMTGVFWLLQLLAEATDLDVLRFVAILLNGLQGVFIFVSYICNKRVLNLYLCSLGIQPVAMTPSKSQRRTKQSNEIRTTESNSKKTSESEVMASSSRKIGNEISVKNTKEDATGAVSSVSSNSTGAATS
ncbi:G-protein coupled receptor Mth [Elysia marginata]|uniref:G-protein coupled receptor Mth n=1 Tax=Elysia marginata TaxID=1093978 RepID=A0AAV4JDJ5_9GAST|nr:G-protein coupled receptor Mth [Elysia marginata]